VPFGGSDFGHAKGLRSRQQVGVERETIRAAAARYYRALGALRGKGPSKGEA
jgi:hypothetical protein